MPLCYVESLSSFRLKFFLVMSIFKNKPIFEKKPWTIAHAFFQKMAQKSPQILLHFLIHIDALMLCRKFELIPTNNFRVISI